MQERTNPNLHRHNSRLEIVVLALTVLFIMACGATTIPTTTPAPTVNETWREFYHAMSGYGIPISYSQEEELSPPQLQALAHTIRSKWKVVVDDWLEDYKRNSVDPTKVGPLCYVLRQYVLADNELAGARTLTEFVEVERELDSSATDIGVLLQDLNPEYDVTWPPTKSAGFLIVVPPERRPPVKVIVPGGLFNSAADCLAVYDSYIP